MKSPASEYLFASACCKFFSTVIYNKPTNFISSIRNFDFECLWPSYSVEQKAILNNLRIALDSEKTDVINLDYFNLFVGNFRKLSYPWGSVYTDRDNLLFGDTERNFKRFCIKNNILIKSHYNEPYDHIGIILLSLSILFERASSNFLLNDINELLESHLLPWFYRFISLMKENASTLFYRSIATLLEQFIYFWEQELEIDVNYPRLYK
ncbi:molecular chaperone [Shewanella xiamenensis]|uniref:TorD/DmsD family molecular chaperone n=1 Tax=Shewanella xiamenensis TaxID=332186 RepID=UPI002E7B0FD0|nr:molecular chaperone TorD family protein [Shewanella xiamenensis]